MVEFVPLEVALLCSPGIRCEHLVHTFPVHFSYTLLGPEEKLQMPLTLLK